MQLSHLKLLIENLQLSKHFLSEINAIKAPYHKKELFRQILKLNYAKIVRDVKCILDNQKWTMLFSRSVIEKMKYMCKTLKKKRFIFIKPKMKC